MHVIIVAHPTKVRSSVFLLWKATGAIDLPGIVDTSDMGHGDLWYNIYVNMVFINGIPHIYLARNHTISNCDTRFMVCQWGYHITP